MCEVLLGLLLLINKEGRAILFLGRLTQSTRMQRLGKMLICTKGDPLASAKLKGSIWKTQRETPWDPGGSLAHWKPPQEC